MIDPRPWMPQIQDLTFSGPPYGGFRGKSEDLSDPFIPHISRTLRPRFRVGLFPFRSQLLRESLLISFPPLIYMLKFRG